MKITSYLGACALAGGLLLPATVGAAPKQTPAPAKAAAPGFTSKVTATPGHAKVGKDTSLTVSLVNKGAAVPGANVDLEVYDAKNKKVAQHTWGTYTVKVGVFSSDWKNLRYWVDKAPILPAS